jgi:hypothetical protein
VCDSLPSLNPYFVARDRRLQSAWPYEPQQPIAASQSQNAGEGALPTARFALGELIYTGNVTLRLRTEEVLTALRRHANGDWGDLLPEDAIANDLALQQGRRLFSAYGFGRDRFWVITDFGLSQTTVLLPDD